MAAPLAGRAGPAQDGLHPQGELPRAERLGHVVVGAALKPQHPVALLAERGQHDHRQRRPGVPPLAQAPADLQAADSRQHQVEHHQIGPPRRGDLQGGLPVHRVPGLQPGVAQVVHDDLRHGQVIFDNENACVHDPSLRTPDRIGTGKRSFRHYREIFLRIVINSLPGIRGNRAPASEA